MKKVIATLVCMFLLPLLSSCGAETSEKETNTEDQISPDVTAYNKGNTFSMTYYYLVDNNTGVVYLVADGYRRNSMTVMLNADGSPVTADQIGLEMGEEIQ